MKIKIKSKFLLALIIFSVALIIICGAFLIYVNATVSDYDRIQPERIVEEQIKRLNNGEFVSEIDFDAFCKNRYENNDPSEYKNAYSSKVVGKELTYKLVTTESVELSKTYIIISGEETVAKITVKGENPRTKMFFFASADWSVSDFTPIITDTVYNLQVYCPEGITAKINGVQPAEDERESDSKIPLYAVSGLLKAPEITYTDSEGNEIQYTVENNIVKPVLFDYRIALPRGAGVLVNGKAVSGTVNGNEEIFLVREMEEPDIVIKDGMGVERKYNSEEEIPLFAYTVSIPENSTLSVEGMTLLEPEITENPDAAKLLKYAGVELPKQKTYTFSLFGESITAEVSDGSKSKKFDVQNGSTFISCETLDSVPENIAEEIDVLYVMELWSKFMTNDIGGSAHGFNTIAAYLIPDSEYYTYARQWAYGIDITFTSDHYITGFNKESVSNFTSYTSDCFSCNVYFEKGMTLTYNGHYAGSVNDIFNSVVYFVKIDDGSWRIAVMHDNIEEE